MDAYLNPRLIAGYEYAAWVAGAVVAGIGTLALIGWALDITPLKSLGSGPVKMNPTTALALTLEAAALMLSVFDSAKWKTLIITRVCSAAAAAFVGFVTLLEYLSAIPFETVVDQGLISKAVQLENRIYPGRMAAATAAGITLNGMALLFLDARFGRGSARWLAGTGFVIAMFELMGYVYDVKTLYHLEPYSSMALHTVPAIGLLSIGILFARPRQGLMALVVSESNGGLVARRVLPVAVLLPFVIGWLCLAGQRAGVYKPEAGVALFALSSILLLSAVIAATAGLLDRIDRRRHQTERQVRQARDRLDSILSAMRDVVWSFSASDYEMLYLNPATETLFGRPKSDFSEDCNLWYKIIHPEDRKKVLSAFKAFETGEPFEQEYRILRPDGEVRWVLDRGTLIRDAESRPVRIDGISSDITMRKQNEAQILHLNRIYAVLSRINSTIVRVTDRRQLLEQCCHIAVDQGGYQLAWIGLVEPESNRLEIMAKAGKDDGYLAKAGPEHGFLIDAFPSLMSVLRENTAHIAIDIEADPLLGDGILPGASSGLRSFILLPLRLKGKPAGVFALYAQQRAFFEEAEHRLLNEVVGDISYALDNIDKQETINYLACYDLLTELPNRALFTDRLQRTLATARREVMQVAVLLFAIERFRNINESLGRQAGDTLLRLFAQRLKKQIRDNDNLARVGANNFAIFLSGLRDAAEVVPIFEYKLGTVLNKPFHINNHELWVAVRTGISVYPDDTGDAATLLRNAEAALSQAKNIGERYLFYTASMHAGVANKLNLENRLRHAIEANQLVLHYQPRFDLESRRITGVEALIRWNDPQSGLVPPADFVPLLEETGLIIDAGLWALRQAIRDRRVWMEMGLVAPRVAVNVSPRQLRQKDFVDTVKAVLAQTGGTDHGLDLEITESLLMEDIHANIAKIEACGKMGMHIAVDDFGTGYSSLAYVARLPVHSMKIDRSFIAAITGSADDTTIISTIISLAHSLKITAVAEGVEINEQARLLKSLRCDEAQGFLFCRPLPAEQLAATLSTPTTH